MVNLGWCSFGESVANAIESLIPESVRGTFSAYEVTIRIGPHDVITDLAATAEYTMIQANWSLAIWGYGSPNDWIEARRKIWNLDIVREIRDDLQNRLDEVNVSVYWIV